ncbi:MAG: hypothetical protein JOZ68_02900 [Acidimicrobiia bacterium]|nr:hypothetical protein [Acidimicrobiia bacterium]
MQRRGRAWGAIGVMVGVVMALVVSGALVAPAQADTAVSISGSGCAGATTFCFVPAQSTVANGTTVTWTNQTTAPHTVTRCTPAACNGTDAGSGSDASFTSGNVAASNGATFSHAFNGAGTYNYYCQIHGYAVMHGIVTVQSAVGTTTTTATASAPTTVVPSPPNPPPPAAAVSGNVSFTG